MNKANFLDILPLPEFDGLPLAVTATRALEHWSDRVDGAAKLAPLKPGERIDIIDECLDIVVPRAEMPAGFEFAGMNVAEFRAVLKAARRPDAEREAWDRIFLGDALATLREAARKRVAVRDPGTWLHQHEFSLSTETRQIADVSTPDALQQLFAVLYPDRESTRRNRLAVEVSEIYGVHGYSFLTKGKQFRSGRTLLHSWLIYWGDQRLQPQPEVGNVACHELQLLLPSLETSYFSNHFRARNIFAHLRVSEFKDDQERRVMLLDEIQSDWMRDLRWQRLGRPLAHRRTHVGQGRKQAPAHIPECPLEKDWLAIAMKVFLDYARRRGADVVAWTPGRIQSELNPGLPLATAERLYDRRVRRQLAKCLPEAELLETDVQYPTYRRNVLIQYQRKNGWFLVRPDGKTKASKPVPDWDAVMQLYRFQAQPVVERLPAFYLADEEAWIRIGGGANDSFDEMLGRFDALVQHADGKSET